ncbi:ceramide synthase 1 [Anaeramoeba flamelloides]|uniref:Ceramide synthase 1 n=1 Tax=Anaeramoeba flamelloides TaxID=1746091 RepID=A0ABQ8Z2S1_9EUKA|nr:ceramide synthase 1 [Anaeramoeba flamelloides]
MDLATLSTYFEKIFFYKQANGTYEHGPKDLITFFILAFLTFFLRQLMVGPVSNIWIKKVTKDKKLKFRHLMFQSNFRTLCIVVMICAMWNTPLLKRTIVPYLDFQFLKHIELSHGFTLGTKFIYLLQLSYISIILPNLHRLENGKGVYLMYLHHFVTAVVVLTSYYYYFDEFGVPIFFVNDMGVVLLYYGKIIRYLDHVKASKVMLCFLLFFYFALRGLAYPLHVVTAILQGPSVFPTPNGLVIFYAGIIIPLVVLEFMQIAWLLILLKMFYQLIFLKILPGDMRSDNEKLSQENKSNKNNENEDKNKMKNQEKQKNKNQNKKKNK